MPDDKDRLGDKLRQKEKAEEDRFFAERDKALVEKLRRSKASPEKAGETARMQCPKCGSPLVKVDHLGVTVEECPNRHGMWLDEGELETLAERDRNSWLGRFFYRPKR
jgi:hypothetical protein